MEHEAPLVFTPNDPHPRRPHQQFGKFPQEQDAHTAGTRGDGTRPPLRCIRVTWQVAELKYRAEGKVHLPCVLPGIPADGDAQDFILGLHELIPISRSITCW